MPRRKHESEWEVKELKIGKFKQSIKTKADFLKVQHFKNLPATLTLLRVEEREFNGRGAAASSRKLVAIYQLNPATQKLLDDDYLAMLDRLKIAEIRHILNMTNMDQLQQQFGEETDNWHGQVQLQSTMVRNPQTNSTQQSLLIVAQRPL